MSYRRPVEGCPGRHHETKPTSSGSGREPVHTVCPGGRQHNPAQARSQPGDAGTVDWFLGSPSTARTNSAAAMAARPIPQVRGTGRSTEHPARPASSWAEAFKRRSLPAPLATYATDSTAHAGAVGLSAVRRQGRESGCPWRTSARGTRHRIRCRSGVGAAGLRYAGCVRAIRAALPRDAITVSRNINPEPAASRDLQRRTA